jgi:Rv2993c-like, N-terminal
MATAPKRWARFQSQGGLAGFGILDGDRITEYSGDMFAEPRPMRAHQDDRFVE